MAIRVELGVTNEEGGPYVHIRASGSYNPDTLDDMTTRAMVLWHHLVSTAGDDIDEDAEPDDTVGFDEPAEVQAADE